MMMTCHVPTNSSSVSAVDCTVEVCICAVRMAATVNSPTQASVIQTPTPSNCSTSGTLRCTVTMHNELIKAYIMHMGACC